MNKIDARGRSCPEPVIMTQEGLKEFNNKLEVLVDLEVAVENIKRFVTNKGFKVDVEDLKNGEFKIFITK